MRSAEAAERIGCTREQVVQYAKTRVLDSQKRGHKRKHYYFDPEEIEAALNARDFNAGAAAFRQQKADAAIPKRPGRRRPQPA